MKRSVLFIVLFTFFKIHVTLAQGCSQCKLIAEQGTQADESTFGANLNFGILYLMIIPYLILMFLFRKQLIRFVKQLFSKS